MAEEHHENLSKEEVSSPEKDKKDISQQASKEEGNASAETASAEAKNDDQPSPRAVEMVDEIKSPLKPLPLKDKNWSNTVFVLILAYLVGMSIYLVFGHSYGINMEQGKRVGFLLLPIIIGNVLGGIGWLLGKIIFGFFSGYELSFLTLSGLCYEKHREVKGKKGKVQHLYFNPSYFLELHAYFSPKNRNVDADPTMMLIGGFIGWGIMFGLMLGLGTGLNPQINQDFVYGSFFSAIHSIEIFIYQALPFRQDYPNDAYTLRTTRKPDDRKAFNIYCIDTAYEFADQDIISPDFENDSHSYWKARTLIYKYINALYQGDLANCFKILTEAHASSQLFTPEEKAYIAGERLFILLLLNDRAGADMLFTGLNKDVKSLVLKPYRLSTYRNSLLVKGLILNKEDDSIAVAKRFYSFELTEKSTRFRQEKRYFETARAAVLKAHPLFQLPKA